MSARKPATAPTLTVAVCDRAAQRTRNQSLQVYSTGGANAVNGSAAKAMAASLATLAGRRDVHREGQD